MSERQLLKDKSGVSVYVDESSQHNERKCDLASCGKKILTENGNLTPVSTSPHAGREPIGFSVIDFLCYIYFSLSLFKKEVERQV